MNTRSSFAGIGRRSGAISVIPRSYRRLINPARVTPAVVGRLLDSGAWAPFPTLDGALPQARVTRVTRRQNRPTVLHGASMPFLTSESEWCELRFGANLLGGRGDGSVGISTLAPMPPTALLLVRGEAAPVIRRLPSRVEIRVD